MRRSRDELAKDIERMVELRNQNKTFRQIAQIMGYKSPGTISDLLHRRGHYSLVLSKREITALILLIGNSDTASSVPATVYNSIIRKLKKAEGQ